MYRTSIFRFFAMSLTLGVSLLLLISCGGSGKFKITGELTDGSSTNLYIKFFNGEAVNIGVTVARDGKFEALLKVKQPSIVEIIDKENTVIATIYAAPGEEVNVSIDPSNPFAMKASGSKINEQWAALLAEAAPVLNNGRPSDINLYIADYIAEHPDDVLSVLLFVCYYDASIDPLEAEQVLDKLSENMRLSPLLSAYTYLSTPFINPEAYKTVPDFKYRTEKTDSIINFSTSAKPYSLIAVSDENSHRTDSVVPALRDIWKHHGGKRLQIIDIGLFCDTVMWQSNISADSARWTQAWVPGGLIGDALSPLAIPTVPYYILADSTGRQLYRGKSPAPIKDMIK